jgi:transcription initiation factor TFIIE subunit alpha
VPFFRFDVAAWVKTHFIDSEAQKATQGATPGLKIAGSSTNGASQDEGVGIMMAMDKDESARQQERAAEAELKRQQNALPAWHLKSTITGDLTALGIQETRRAEAAAVAAAAMAGAGGSNDEILRGLGIVGVPSRNAVAGNRAVERVVGSSAEEKVKVGQDEADCRFRPFPHQPIYSRILLFSDYDQYYASLAASTTVSALPTPTPGGGRSSESASTPGIELEEEEDRKPDIEYLDSLNEYRKRSRSKEDVDGSSTASGAVGSRKMAKLSPDGSLNGLYLGAGVNGNGAELNGSGVSTPEDVGGTHEDADMGDGYANGNGYNAEEGGESTDDPVVYGKPLFTFIYLR